MLAPLLAAVLLLFAAPTLVLTAHAQAPVAAAAKGAASRPAAAIASERPDWPDLTSSQRTALNPLMSSWSGMSAAQKRKWIALSQNFPKLSPAERDTLHLRMNEWAALSPVQRNQARQNFAQTKQLSSEEKRAQWQAYQALSPAEKQQLAAGALSPAGGAALAPTPVAPNKLATVPITRSDATKPALAASRPVASRTAASKSASAASAPASHQP